jgi:hypothetical protein
MGGPCGGAVLKALGRVSEKPKQPIRGQSISLVAQAQTASSLQLVFGAHPQFPVVGWMLQ